MARSATRRIRRAHHCLLVSVSSRCIKALRKRLGSWSVCRKVTLSFIFVKLAYFFLTDKVDKVDISIVAVTRNAIEFAKEGLTAVKIHTDWRHVRLVLVDSGSSYDNLAWFTSFCEERFCTLFAIGDVGYTAAMNLGIRKTRSKYVVAMNPDVIVYGNWLKHLKTCMDSCPTHAMVGPLSNAASFQSIPKVYEASGAYAKNHLTLPNERLNMYDLVMRLSVKQFPRATFINGFLFMVRREVFDELDGFDEHSFPVGYGEENDFSIRAQNAGYSLAIVDTSYAYHFKTTSFSVDQRTSLSKLGSAANQKRHAQRYKLFIQYMNSQTGFLSTRNRIARELELAFKPEKKILNAKVAYLLPVRGSGGGVISIVQEVRQMRVWGVSAYIAVWERSINYYRSLFPDVKDAFIPFVTVYHLTKLLATMDVVVGTHFSAIELMQQVREQRRTPRLRYAYYVQDYEPYFFRIDDPHYKVAMESYDAIPEMTLFAKTKWIKQQVESKHSRRVTLVRASLDHEIFTPRSCPNVDGHLTITAMVRPSTPRRGAARTLRVLHALKKRFPSEIEIETFGCSRAEAKALMRANHLETKHRHHGVLKRRETARLFRLSDIFIDLSDYQAFGRSLVECMASGCIPVGPTKGGASETIEHGVNGLLVNTDDEAAIIASVSDLIGASKAEREDMALRAVIRSAEYTVENAAVDQLRIFHGIAQMRWLIATTHISHSRLLHELSRNESPRLHED